MKSATATCILGLGFGDPDDDDVSEETRTLGIKPILILKSRQKKVKTMKILCVQPDEAEVLAAFLRFLLAIVTIV